MRSPGQVVEFGFYLRHRAPLLALVDACIEMGAGIDGHVVVHQGPDVADQPAFGTVHEGEPRELYIQSRSDLDELQTQPDTRVAQVSLFPGACAPDRVEVATLLRVDNKGRERLTNPVALWTGIELLPNKNLTFRSGRPYYEAFIELAQALHPIYGSLTIEYGLAAPQDLAAEPSPLLFFDFYICDAVDRKLLKSYEGKGAFIQHLSGGTYVSTSPEFNPLGVSVAQEEREALSLEVSAALASAFG